MRHFACPQTFVKENLTELKELSATVCRKYHRKDYTDVLHDIIVKIYTKPILKNHDPVKGTLYNHLYTVTRNQVISTQEYESRYVSMPTVLDDSHDEADYAMKRASYKYLAIVRRNQAGKLGQDLQHFRHLLSSTELNKTHNLTRRKNKEIQTQPLTLLKLFDLLMLGFTCHEIAQQFGVTDMTITHCKTELRIIMEKHGIRPS